MNSYDEDLEKSNGKVKFNPKKRFETKVIEIDGDTAIYELDYYKSGLWQHIEELLDEEVFVGETIKIKR